MSGVPSDAACNCSACQRGSRPRCEPGPEVGKAIHQRHFEQAMEDVISGKAVMRQSLLLDPGPTETDRIVDALQSNAARGRGLGLAAVAVDDGGGTPSQGRPCD